MDIFQLFDLTVERNASDLHLVPGYFPAIRVNNELLQIRVADLLTEDATKQMLLSLLNEEQKQTFLNNKELDLGYDHKDNRFRINIYFTHGKIAGAFRLIRREIKTIEELSLPSAFHQFANLHQGLVLVTGPTGEGKSATLASIINEINLKYAKHIVTIEDPIEYVYPPSRSIISQREIHQDLHSWSTVLKSVLREDPDIVLIGEMRDYETIQAALTIAETGHLVFSTLHTGATPETINRIIDVFPATQQNQIRNQLASVLRAVIAQRLIPDIAGTGRIPAIELLLNIPAVASVIRDGRTNLIDNMLETGESQGLLLFEKYLLSLYDKGRVSKEVALAYAFRPNEIKKLLTGQS
ncbi:PilT/PilU family type 4a pilus ATPase [Candidatus Roizmanbacteria bacterium]|nr:PilT/PilU family type 4a pilus ATPase [Candidatus Roizmanbacteria bacterium]